MHHLAAANIYYLQQGLDMLSGLTDKQYTRTKPPMFSSGIGPHLRHALDHYASFVDSWREGRIDYDSRERDPRMESDRAYAGEHVVEVIEALKQVALEDGDQPVAVKMDAGGSLPDTANWSKSTVTRELQFLISHTVHHFALIAVLLRLQKIEPAEGFGVAPSTLRYHQQSKLQCAR